MKRLLAVLAAALALAATSAAAQTYPTRPVTIIVPFAAGGPTDIIARIVGEYFSKTLGQQFIVENVAGAGGTTGITRGAQATPDGYTIMMGHMGTHGAAPALYPNLKYDPTKDFEPIGLAAGTPILIVARKDFPAGESEGVRRAPERPGSKSQPGACRRRLGVVHDLHAADLAARRETTSSLPIAAPARPSTTSSADRSTTCATRSSTWSSRSTAAPSRPMPSPRPSARRRCPTFPPPRRPGLPDYQVSAWNALFAPKGTPKEIVAKLNETLVKALDDDATRKRLLELGSVLPDKAGRSPEALANLVKSEVARWTPILKAAGAVGTQ